MKLLLQLATIFMPWIFRRWLLREIFGYDIDPTARIGFSFVFPQKLIMRAHSNIGHLNVIKGHDLVHLDEHATIGKLNWITAYPSYLKKHFMHNSQRKPNLIVCSHAAITSRHLIDCTDEVIIGPYSILAGFQSQIITHSIDLKESRQSCKSVSIGKYCFVGTNSVLLGGSFLPDYCVLGAKSLLNRQYQETYMLYAGVPARPIKNLEHDDKFFLREQGFVA